MNPTLAGFIWFIQNVMGITTANLPTSAPVIAFAYNLAYNTVNAALANVPNNDTTQPTIYATAVYNLAGDYLINFAQDATPTIDPPSFFNGLRASFGCNSFTAGVINSTSDEGTSESMTVSKAFDELTIGNLQNLHTPYGRAYLAIAQSYGALWGLS